MKNKLSLNAAIALCNIGIMIMFCLYMHGFTVKAKEITASVESIERGLEKTSLKLDKLENNLEKTDKMLDDLESKLKNIDATVRHLRTNVN
jgi:peptidoglycan hydrolase CwlO-like protein